MEESNALSDQPTRRLKKLIIVRHGEYDKSTKQLNGEGEQQIRNLIPELKSRINGDTLLMFSSPEARAVQSAEILAFDFNLPFEKKEFLVWGDERPNREAAIEMVRSRENAADVILLVTHLEYSRDFPQHFFSVYLNTNFRERTKIEKGKALVIDCDKKTVERI